MGGNESSKGYPTAIAKPDLTAGLNALGGKRTHCNGRLLRGRVRVRVKVMFGIEKRTKQRTS